MDQDSFMETVASIRTRDARFEAEAYVFVREALDYTVKLLKKPRKGPGKHVTGQELLDGIRKYALQEFGPMALTVLKQWGVRQTEDFGAIVFNLVESGQLGRTEQDRKEDFAGGYSFHEAFAKPFLPSGTATLTGKRKTKGTGRRRGGTAKREESKDG